MHARSVDSWGGTQQLFPPGGACAVDGVRPYLPPLERALYRTLMYARRAHLRLGAGGGFPRDQETLARTAARLGRYLCGRPVRPSPVRVQLVWYAHTQSYESGERGRANLLQLDRDCVHDRPTELRWEPSDLELVAFWGGEPWAAD